MYGSVEIHFLDLSDN